MAAQTYYWTDDDGDHSFINPTGNNWRTAAGVAAGAGVFPGSVQADNLLLADYAAAAPSVAIDQSGTYAATTTTSLGILNVTVEDGYAYALGTKESPFGVEVAATAVWTFKGNDHGDIWMFGDTAAVAAVHVLDCSSSGIHLAFGTTICTLANIMAGTVYLEPSMHGVTSLGVTTLNCAAQPNGSQPTIYIDAPVTTLNNYGAVIEWRAGTIGTLNNYGGTTRCEKSTTARTLTASNCYGGTVDFRTGKPGTITLTGAIAYKGGEILWDIGESLQRS